MLKAKKSPAKPHDYPAENLAGDFGQGCDPRSKARTKTHKFNFTHSFRVPCYFRIKRGSTVPFRKGLLDRTRSLSQRQYRVTEMVTQGMKNSEIATMLGIRVHVVRNYVSAVYDKVGVSNRVELALWYEARRYESNLSHRVGSLTAY